jgi:5-methylcytosine-specific restriction enzyme A
MPGGWVERPLTACRWCGAEVPKTRRTFCGPACVHEWKLRTNPGYLREQVFARDRGVCASCGADTEALRKHRRKLDYAARPAFDKEWGRRKSLWDADHIVPVVEGGGECSLDNLRTLCLKCHRRETALLRARRSKSAPRPKPVDLRDQVFARDLGVCAICGVDTEALRREKRKLDFAARRAFEKEWGRGALWQVEGDTTRCVKCSQTKSHTIAK